MSVDSPDKGFRLWLWLIRLIGVIVPRRLRSDWRQEWEAELQYRESMLSEWDKLDRSRKFDLFVRSLGAFTDALVLQPRRLEAEMFQDLSYGARMLMRQRMVTAAAICVLALGIGANTAIFSVINATLLRPLPYLSPERMVLLWGNFMALKAEQLPAKAAEYIDYRDQTESFEAVAAFNNTDFVLTGGEQPERISGAAVSTNLFPMLGAHPSVGTLFSSDQNEPGRENVVVVSHAFWQRRLGGDSNAIGRSLTLNDSTYTVIGVMPAGFQFPHPSFNFAEPAEIWVPLVFSVDQVAKRQRPYYLNVIGRLKNGVTLEQARLEMTTLGARFEQQYQGYLGPNHADSGWRITVVPLMDQIVGKSRRALFVLLIAVVLVLLMACANAANLLLMRAIVRRKELAIRSALGASRLRLIRQLLTESLLIATVSGIAGLLLAWIGIRLLSSIGSANVPRLAETSIDTRVLLFTLTISILTGLIFGIAPAVQASKPDLQQTLKDGFASKHSRLWLRKLLVIGEVATATVLLVGAGLMLNSFLHLQRINPIVDSAKLLSISISLPANRYPETAQVSRFYQEALRRVEELPSVESAAVTSIQPLSGIAINDPFSVEGRALDLENAPTAGWQFVSPHYFRSLGIGVTAGRDFNDLDVAESSGSVIINEAMARRYFPNQNPIGKRMTLGLPRPDNPWQTIVGIVNNIPHRGIESTPEPDWYGLYSRQPGRDVYLLIRTSRAPGNLASALRDAIQAIDKDQPLTSIKTLNEVIAGTTAPRRFSTSLLTIFATIGLTIAAVGIYGVLSFSVSQRTQEIGIRMALGARQRDVIRMMISQGMVPVVVGVLGGLVIALAGARAISGLLFDITPTDATTFITVLTLISLVAMIACYLPARCAARVDPMIALKRG
jgi:putative ABC transport system permease protein